RVALVLNLLSVPSSSGNTLQLCPCLTILNHPPPFSPLFIGEYSATSRWERTTPDARSILSVPSSSGNTLQPAGASTSATELVPFGPLFIGEYSATLNEADRVADRERPFSPLFIGEYSATMNGHLLVAVNRITFQSPLHRGILCNDERPPSGGRQQDYLSVPSSSGNTLQQRCHSAERKFSSTFSPLFIGEYSAT